MRQIKFRAWDKERKRWCVGIVGYELLPGDASSAVSVAITTDGEIVGVSNYSNVGVVKFDKNRIELMQFTGLLDKNGKEIYEGDIIMISHWSETPPINTPIRHETDIIPVKWVLGRFNIAPERYLNGDVYEIIGNIYENPELLTPVDK